MKTLWKLLSSALIVAALCVPAFASTQTKRPSRDVQTTGAWSISPASPANGYSHVSETAADDSAVTYVTSAGRVVFGIGNGADVKPFTIPAEAISTTLTVYYRAKNNTGTTGTMATSLRIAGVAYDNPVCPAITASWANYSYSYVTNPATGVGWTANDINSLSSSSNSLCAFGVYSTNATGNPLCSQCYAVVTYALPSGYTNAEDAGWTGTDDSGAIKWACDSAGATLNGVAFFPKEDSAWKVKPTTYGTKTKGCIAPSNNTKILFADGTTICCVAGSITPNANYVVFEMLNAKGVTITSNGTWFGYMNKEEFTQPSQWNHFGSYRTAEGCLMSNGAIYGTGGDGCFVGSELGALESKNLTFSKMLIDSPSRHCFGVNNVDGLTIQGSILQNASGCLTQTGIDLEADAGGNTTHAAMFKNILIYHNQILNNAECGILLHMQLANGSDPRCNTIEANIIGNTITGVCGIKSVGPGAGGQIGSVTISSNIIGPTTKRGIWMASHDSSTFVYNFYYNYLSNCASDDTTQINLINVDAELPLSGSNYGNFNFTGNTFLDTRGASRYILEAFKQTATAGFFGLFGSANALVGSSPFKWYIPNPRTSVTPVATIEPAEWTATATATPTATPTATATDTPTMTPTATATSTTTPTSTITPAATPWPTMPSIDPTPGKWNRTWGGGASWGLE